MPWVQPGRSSWADRRDWKPQERLGADVLVNIQKEDAVEGVRAATGGAGVDEVFECSGSEGTLNQAIRMVRQGGQIGLLGVPTDKVIENIPFKYLCRNEIGIFGSKANPNVSDQGPCL